MLGIVTRGGTPQELARERDSLLSRLLRVVMDVTPRTYAEGGREALEQPTWEPGSEHREAVQNKADDLAGELAKVAHGMAEDAASLLDDVEGARGRGIKYTDPAGREQDPEYWARMLATTHDAVIRNAGHLNAALSIGSRGVRVSDGGPGDVDEPCVIANGQRWSLDFAARNVLQHPWCRRSFAALAPGDDAPLDRS